MRRACAWDRASLFASPPERWANGGAGLGGFDNDVIVTVIGVFARSCAYIIIVGFVSFCGGAFGEIRAGICGR